QVEQRLARLRIDLVGEVLQPDLLGLDSNGLLPRAELAVEAVENWDRDAELRDVSALEGPGLPSGLLIGPAHRGAGQILRPHRAPGSLHSAEPLPLRRELAPVSQGERHRRIR